jgi:hypothetical protein
MPLQSRHPNLCPSLTNSNAPLRSVIDSFSFKHNKTSSALAEKLPKAIACLKRLGESFARPNLRNFAINLFFLNFAAILSSVAS